MAFSESKWWEALPRPSWSRFKKVKQSQQWFEVYQVVPGVFAIYEPGQWEEVISYLVVGTKRAILFDTGLGVGNIRKAVSELTALDPMVINSHTHYDHVGGNYQFREIRARETDFSSKNSKGMPPDDAKQSVPEDSFWKPVPDGFFHKEYSIHPFKISHPLSIGQRFDLGDRTLEVIFTPGHSSDSVCLIDRKNRILFTGDTFYPAPLYAHRPESNFQDYLKSALLLESIASSVDYVLPAHNETLMPSEYLIRLGKAFSSIQDGTVRCVQKNENCEYKFDGFSIITQPLPEKND